MAHRDQLLLPNLVENVRNATRKFDSLRKAKFRIRNHPRLGRSNPVAVFTMGKVGSSAIHATVAAELDRPSIQCHRVTKAGLRASDEWHRRHGTGTKANVAGPSLHWLFAKARDGRKTDIICGVRDPIARDVSAAFQNGQRFGLFDVERPTLSKGDIESIQSYIIKFRESTLSTETWFDNELKPATGIDVWESSFDDAKGYQTYENDRCRVLLLRFENLQSIASEAFEAFFSVPGVTLQERNVGTQKKYSTLYRQFKEEAKFPSSVLDSAYSSRYSQHFYTPTEIAGFRSQWFDATLRDT